LAYEGASKSFRTGCVEPELQMVQLSATRCSSIASEFCRHNPLCYFSASVHRCACLFRYRLSPKTCGFTLVNIFV